LIGVSLRRPYGLSHAVRSLLSELSVKILAKTTASPANHVPMLSQPGAVAQVIIDAARSIAQR
jgi:hypothetical protein